MKPAQLAMVVVALFGVAASAAADDPPVEHAGEVTYSIPPGWERVEQDRVVVLTPRDVAPEQCSVVLTPGETLGADANFNKWFKDKWDALTRGWKLVQGGERTGREGPRGSSVFYQAGMLEAVVNGKVTRTGLLLYAVHVGDAVHWVVFRTDGATLFNQHKKTVNAFLGGLKFAETTAEAPKHGPAEKPKPKPPPAASGSRS
jgi:hypothetical protein